MDRPPTPPAATPAKVIVGEPFLTAALKKTTPPANILHPSRIIRLRPPSEGKRTESLTFTRGDGIPLPLPPDTSDDCRIFVCNCNKVSAHLATDDFDMGALFYDTPLYVSLGRQEKMRLTPQHFVDGFYAQIVHGRLVLLFTTVCPTCDYSGPANLTTFPDIMLECSLEWNRHETLGSSLDAYCTAESQKSKAFPREFFRSMIRLAITSLGYIESHRHEFKLRYPGLPDTVLTDDEPEVRMTGRLATFIEE